MLRIFIFIATLVSSLQANPAAPTQTVWVTHTFMGGPQCASSGSEAFFNAPGFEAQKIKFRRAKVAIYREYFRDIPVCQACEQCPRYHREIWFEIGKDDAASAARLGYRPAENAPGPDDTP